MIKISVQIDGNKFPISDIGKHVSSRVEQLIVLKLIEHVQKMLNEKLSEKELHKVNVAMKGNTVSDLSINISAPSDLLKKLR